MPKEYMFVHEEPNTNILNVQRHISAMVSNEIKEFAGANITSAWFKVKNHRFEWGPKRQEWYDAGKIYFENLKKNPALALRSQEKVMEIGARIQRLCLPLADSGARELDDAERVRTVETLFEDTRLINAYGFIGPIMELPFGFVTNELNRILDCHVKDFQETKEEYLVTLTTPTEQYPMSLVHTELMQIAAKLKQDGVTAETVHTHNSSEIDAHVQKYPWIVYSYRGPIRDRVMVIDELKMLLEQEDIAKRLGAAETERLELRMKQARYETGLKLTEYERDFFRASKAIAFTKLYRKDMLALANYTIHLVSSPIYQAQGLTLNDVDIFTVEEFIPMLAGISPLTREEIAQRQENVMYIAHPSGNRVLSGDAEVDAWIKDNVDFGDDVGAVSEVKGQVASLGNGEEIIKAVIKRVETPADMKNFNEGDILLSSGTTPDLLPAMRRAAAIVTDQGGLTSHAAIVSRELKKPCIIGTQHATKVFQSGEMVEFHVKKGIVKKV